MLLRTLGGLAAALVAWCALVAGVIFASGSSWRAIWRAETATPWWAVLLTSGMLLALAGPTLTLCGYYHVFGTDKVGQDVLYLALKSIRTGLVIGTLTTLVLLP